MAVRVIEVNPPEGFRASRVSMNAEVLEEGYLQGLEAGKLALDRWEKR